MDVRAPRSEERWDGIRMGEKWNSGGNHGVGSRE